MKKNQSDKTTESPLKKSYQEYVMIDRDDSKPIAVENRINDYHTYTALKSTYMA